MQDFIDKKIILGVCGGIAAYKAAFLLRELTCLGAEVRVVMTSSACEFITPLTMQALSGNDVRTEVFDEQAERAMGHIELARWADYLVIAPATANCLAKLAHGQADDLLSTLYLVADLPAIVCPAMNKNMWHHPATQENCRILRQRNVMIVGPEEGSQACGDYGLGRLAEVEVIINAIRLQPSYQCLSGKSVMITAGPTREAIDPVRFLSNYSSGKMGYALAVAAQAAGAKVILISGPVALPQPAGMIFYPVLSAKEMHHQVMTHLQPGMIFIGCAAVSDYAPETCGTQKIKKHEQPSLTLPLKTTPDILKDVSLSKKACFVVGFAAETQDLILNAQKKRQDKQLDMVIANQVGIGQGFEQDSNQVTIVTEREEKTLPLTHKVRLAGQIIAVLAQKLIDDHAFIV